MITTDSAAPLVVVTGATGQQGGSVVSALSASSNPYRVRGLTRDASKAGAKKLSEKGVEVVQVNLVVEEKEAVQKAYEGADYLFCVTNFWEHMDMNKEIAEGKMMVDLARSIPTLKRLIWSGLENVSSGSKGKYTKVAHYDGKSQVTAYALTFPDLPFTNVQAGMYSGNLSTPMMAPRPDSKGGYTLKLPLIDINIPYPVINCEKDYGLFVLRAIESPKGLKDELLTYGEMISMKDQVDQLSEFTGKQIKLESISGEEYKQLLSFMPPAVQEEMVESWQFQTDPAVGYYCGKSVGTHDGFFRRPQTWKEALQEADWDTILAGDSKA